MAQLVIPNCAMARLQWISGTRTWQQAIGLTGNPSLPVIDQAMANSVMADANSAFTSSAIGGLLPTTVSMQRVGLRSLASANLTEFQSNNAGSSGTATAVDLLPLSNAAVVTIRTAGQPAGGSTAHAQSFRGRTYFSGFSEAQNDVNGRTAAAVNTAIVAFMTNWNTALLARGLRMAVLSRPRDGQTIPERIITAKAGFSTVAVVFEARNTKWESQRRRNGKV